MPERGARNYPPQIASLPITPRLDEICEALENSPSRFLALTAQTGAGKSTALPLALLNHFKRNIVMLEPRRIAALAVARRVSELLGEDVGGTAGYVMRLEKKVSRATRFTVMTEAVLTRKMQDDPSLDGIDVVVIDEFHERTIHADLALAFLKEAAALREDLRVVVMSATMDTDRLSKYLGSEKNPATVFAIPGRQFPVKFFYDGEMSPARAVAREIKLSKDNGTILVFLPGIKEIRQAQAELARLDVDADISILHSSVPFNEQRMALCPREKNARRLVILSSAIAETSLTVPGVTVVIDSGLSRVKRMNVSAGMETLVTEIESEFSAAQRAGRAGRTAPGRCVRLWRENERRASRIPPEISRSDLIPVALECAAWGAADARNLDWLDAPSEAAWSAAQNVLEMMGCLSRADGVLRITELGKEALKLGLHPRFACAALCGGEENAREAVALAAECDNRAGRSPETLKKIARDIEEKLRRAKKFNVKTEGVSPRVSALLAGFPDRLAKSIDSEARYQFFSGRIARLDRSEREKIAAPPEWIAAIEVDAGEREGIVRKWKPLPPDEVALWLAPRAQKDTRAFFAEGTRKLRKTACECYGKIVVSQKNVPASSEDFARAVCDAVSKNGMRWLPLGESGENFLARARFFKSRGGALDADPSDEALAASADEWLAPFITGASISERDTLDALRFRLDGAAVDKGAPERVTLANGKSHRLKYEAVSRGEIRPTLEIVIQRIFGCEDTPRVMGVPVLLKLLSPARRPLQITDDLRGFWQTAWPDICKEMKGRYPKHNWDFRAKEE